MHRQVLLLVTAQALFQSGSVLLATVGGLAGGRIAPTPSLATAPIAAMLLGTVIATVPASLWMARSGRRAGFIAGSLLGAAGGIVAAAGIVIGSLLVLSLGTMLVGMNQGFAQYYRFAAAEVADPAFRPRAISLVLAGGVAAALLGPALARLGAPMLEPAFAGSFLILTALSLVSAVLLLFLRVPPPIAEAAPGEKRPLGAIMRQPAYAVALFGAATGGGVMALAMTAMPLAMAAHHHGLSSTAIVMQLHVLGMFLPSFFTGAVIARFGVLPVMLAGVAILAGHVASSLSGTGFVPFAAALLLLGIGWNFLYVGGTTLLTTAYRPGEEGRAQGANDLLIYVVGLAAALGAGILLEAIGWQLMNALLLPWLALAAAAILWLRHAQRKKRA